MRKKLKAITVARDYLDKDFYSVKRMITTGSTNELHYWRTQKVVFTSSDLDKATQRARYIARFHTVPYIYGLISGCIVTPSENDILKTYGLSLDG